MCLLALALSPLALADVAQQQQQSTHQIPQTQQQQQHIKAEARDNYGGGFADAGFVGGNTYYGGNKHQWIE